jgi:RHS repeat-associated protein
LAFACNLRNRPVTITRKGGGTQTWQYAFKALDQLVQRAANAPCGPAGTVQYIHGLDGELLAEADAATGRTLREYIWLPQGDISPAANNDNEEGASSLPLPLALVTGVSTTPQPLMVHADHLNRPTRLTDAARATVWSASYDPFGQPVSITGPVEQNLRFPGQYFLIETGLSYNWHRFYDATTGRYTQPDPLRFVDGPSVYGYARQQPTQLTDPSGLQASGVCVIGGPYNPACGVGIVNDVVRACIIAGGLILEMAKRKTGSCSCQHRDIFSSGGVSCQILREAGICSGPYKGTGNDTASCQADARANAPEACKGCVAHCLFRRAN